MAYPIARWILLPIYRLWLREVEGIQNIPENKPFIIAANHTSYYDTLLLPSIVIPRLNKRMCALVDSYYWKPYITRKFLDLWGGIPVYVRREKNYKEKNEISLDRALKCLKNGQVLMIFPEGGRSKNGKLQKAYSGIAKLALNSKSPVLPMGIIDAHKVLPRGKMLPRFKRCEVKIGKLMYFNNYYNKRINNKILERITRKIMKEIARLIGQRYNH